MLLIKNKTIKNVFFVNLLIIFRVYTPKNTTTPPFLSILETHGHKKVISTKKLKGKKPSAAVIVPGGAWLTEYSCECYLMIILSYASYFPVRKNWSRLTFSLNHDFLSPVDIYARSGIAHWLAEEVVVGVVIFVNANAVDGGDWIGVGLR